MLKMSENKQDKNVKPTMICAACAKELTTKKTCSECKAVVYCDADCQKKDWPWHKHMCKRANVSFAKRNKLAQIPDSHAAYHPSKLFVRLVPEFVKYNCAAISVVIVMGLHSGYKAVQITLDKEFKASELVFRTAQDFVKISGIAAVRKLEQVEAFNKTNEKKQTQFCIAINCPELSKKKPSDPEFHILVTPPVTIDKDTEQYRAICKYLKPDDDPRDVLSLFLSLAQGRAKAKAWPRVDQLLLQKRFEADIMEEMAKRA